MKGIQRRTLGVYAQFLGHQFNILNVQSSSRISGHGILLNSRLALQQQTNNNPRRFHTSSSNGLALDARQLLEAEQAATISITESIDGSSTTNSSSSSNSVQATSTNDNNSTRHKNLEMQIKQAEDIDTLLEIADSDKKSLFHSCQIVCNLGTLVQKSSNFSSDSEKIKNDSRFISLCNILTNANFQQTPQFLLFAIQGLHNMKMTQDDTVLQVLENELKWTVRRCPVKHLAKAIEILSTTTTTSLGRKSNAISIAKLNTNHPLVVCVETLQRRWVEVASGTDFISTFRVLGVLNDDTKTKLEDRAVEQVSTFTPLEIIKIFIALSSQKRRATPVLRALAFHFSKSQEKIPAKDLIELMYAMNELTFADPVMMAKICNELQSEIVDMISPALISSLVTSLGQLRYKHKELVQALDEWIITHLNELRPFDCASWLLTCSVLNFQSENTESFCNKAKELLKPETVRSPSSWVNIVHAFLILNQVDTKMMSSILDEKFVTQIDSADQRLLGTKSKLLNVNAASSSLNYYQGPFLRDDIVSKWTASVVNSTDVNFSKSVLESLGNFLPPPKYFQGNNALPCGVFVDAICKLNHKLDPVPYETKISDGKNKIIQVAVIIQGYASFCLGIKEPTGQSCLAVRLLEKDGYHVLPVPYTEFSPQEKLLRRVQYLENRMRNINISKDDNIAR